MAKREKTKVLDYVLSHMPMDVKPLENVLDENMLNAILGKDVDVNITYEDIPIPKFMRYDYGNIQLNNTVSAIGAKSLDYNPNIERPPCPDCFEKHVAQAIINLKEVLQGYHPDNGHEHYHLAIGHLAEASDEIVADNAELANDIREIRLRLMDAYAKKKHVKAKP
jgi:hypothetical protein